MSTATASTASIREILLQKVSTLSADYCPQALRYIETLEEDDYENWSDEQREEWLRSNPPIPIEDDPAITPEHLERLRRRFKDMDEGKTKVISFDDAEWEEFCQEVEHSPEEALAKAYSRAYYPPPKQS